MFYSVLASLIALLPLWYLLEPWGNNGLWWAFLGFVALGLWLHWLVTYG